MQKGHPNIFLPAVVIHSNASPVNVFQHTQKLNPMKHFFLVLSILFSYGYSLAQYQLESGESAYANLTGDTLLHDDTWTTFDDFAIDLGFDFQILDFVGNRAWVVAGFGIAFKYEGAVTGSEYILVPLEFSLIDRLNEEEGSSISYVTEGAPGSRITKVQFRNAAFLHRSAETDFIDFQVWLYETTNVVEFHYGPQQIEDLSAIEERESQELSVGIMDKFLLPDLSFGLSGNASMPDLVVYDWQDETRPDLQLIPEPDTYYRLAPGNLSAREIRNFSTRIDLFPNPAGDRFKLATDLDCQQILLFDANARLLKTWESPRGWLTLPPGFSGMGILKIIGDFGVAGKVLIRR